MKELQKKYSQEQISEFHNKLSEIRKFPLPDSLWEGGLSIYKKAVDDLRGKQEQLSGIVIEVEQEHYRVSRACSLLKKIIEEEIAKAMKEPAIVILNSLKERQIKAESMARAKHKGAEEMLEYLGELTHLKDLVMFVYQDLNKARSDLRLKVELLGMEASQRGYRPGIMGHPRKSIDQVSWEDMKLPKKEGEKDVTNT